MMDREFAKAVLFSISSALCIVAWMVAWTIIADRLYDYKDPKHDATFFGGSAGIPILVAVAWALVSLAR